MASFAEKFDEMKARIPELEEQVAGLKIELEASSLEIKEQAEALVLKDQEIESMKAAHEAEIVEINEAHSKVIEAMAEAVSDLEAEKEEAEEEAEKAEEAAEKKVEEAEAEKANLEATVKMNPALGEIIVPGTDAVEEIVGDSKADAIDHKAELAKLQAAHGYGSKEAIAYYREHEEAIQA